mmetsp:Transcript_28985/g.67141  ORF Transcript_28985/g.67141 Transcript_28985/m.67141 type:complete len:898 (-) Transcript_28985:175-2868(-)
MIKASDNNINSPLTFFLNRICETEFTDHEVKIAPTLMFEQGRPVCWYDEVLAGNGEMKPRPRRELTSKNVQLAWNGKKKDVQHIPSAVFVSYSKVAQGAVIQSGGDNLIQHLSCKKIDELFSETDPNVKGIMVPFIRPANGYNSMIRVNWSRYIFMAERRTNKLKMDHIPDGGDHKPYPQNAPNFNMYGNVVTFEGADTLTWSGPLNPSLAKTLRRFCTSLANIIKPPQRVLQFTAYFKTGPNNTIYFLWSSSVKLCKVGGGKAGDIGFKVKKKSRGKWIPFKEQVPRGLIRSGTPDLLLPPWTPKPRHSSQCASCSQKMSLHRTYHLPFRTLVEKHDQALAEEDSNVYHVMQSLSRRERGAASALDAEPTPRVPPLIQKLVIGITPERWELLKTQTAFLIQSAFCCYNCARVYEDDPMPVMQAMKSPPPPDSALSLPLSRLGTAGSKKHDLDQQASYLAGLVGTSGAMSERYFSTSPPVSVAKRGIVKTEGPKRAKSYAEERAKIRGQVAASMAPQAVSTSGVNLQPDGGRASFSSSSFNLRPFVPQKPVVLSNDSPRPSLPNTPPAPNRFTRSESTMALHLQRRVESGGYSLAHRFVENEFDPGEDSSSPLKINVPMMSFDSSDMSKLRSPLPKRGPYHELVLSPQGHKHKRWSRASSVSPTRSESSPRPVTVATSVSATGRLHRRPRPPGSPTREQEFLALRKQLLNVNARLQHSQVGIAPPRPPSSESDAYSPAPSVCPSPSTPEAVAAAEDPTEVHIVVPGADAASRLFKEVRAKLVGAWLDQNDNDIVSLTRLFGPPEEPPPAPSPVKTKIRHYRTVPTDSNRKGGTPSSQLFSPTPRPPETPGSPMRGPDTRSPRAPARGPHRQSPPRTAPTPRRESDSSARNRPKQQHL